MCFLGFFVCFFRLLWQERSLPHHQLKFLFCKPLSVAHMETMKKEKLSGASPTWEAGAYYSDLRGTISDGF